MAAQNAPSRGIDAPKTRGSRDHLAGGILSDAQADAVAAVNQGTAVTDVSSLPGFGDLTLIPWPDVPFYGSPHARHTAQLAGHIASTFLGLSGEDLEVVQIAAAYHDVGRTQPWQRQDPAHGERSAAITERVLRGTHVWGNGDLIHEACKLIARHKLPPLRGHNGPDVPRPTDPRAQALWDADCYEAARFEPGNHEALLVVRQRFNHVVTPWAALPPHKERYRRNKGWPK